MKKQLEDVVHVAVVNILSSGSEAKKNYVERDLMLAKVSTTSAVLMRLLAFHSLAWNLRCESSREACLCISRVAFVWRA